MENGGGYVPPAYIPLEQSDPEASTVPREEEVLVQWSMTGGLMQWSSGICACCDDMPSCCIGLICPCYLFSKNAEFLGSGTLIGSCTIHFLLWALDNAGCCLLTDGILLGLPGCFVSCYTCSYRKALRSKYGLEEAPCGDFVTHFFCHLCAVCQEYIEILNRSAVSSHDLSSTAVTASPPPHRRWNLLQRNRARCCYAIDFILLALLPK